jgi:murein DD-endopeptidase MepM/ murein hydrolase activator NlpD
MPVLGFPPERLVRSFDRVSRPRRPPGRAVTKAALVAGKGRRAGKRRVAAGERRGKRRVVASKALGPGKRPGKRPAARHARRVKPAVAAARTPPGRHEAIDIPAPRYTPVIAVDDGTVAKRFYSRDGGITLYHFDPERKLVYYYAHLEAYAEGINEGDPLLRGQVIGYVGTTGNSPPHAPHLHFAVHLLTPERVWYRGTPIDPYDLLR